MEDIWETFYKLKNVSSNNETSHDRSCRTTCDNCGNIHLCEDKFEGTIVCTNCGMVKESQLVDDSPEWNFGPEEAMFAKDPSRCGGPVNPLLERSSMSTVMVNANYRTHGNLKRLHQQTSMDYIERSRYHIFEYISKLAHDKGKLTMNVVEQAKKYYTDVSKKRLSRGNIRKGIIACCIYQACKDFNVTRSIKEISDFCDIDCTHINKCIKIFREVMENETKSSTEADDLFIRIINKFNFSRVDEAKLLKQSRKVYETVEEHCILNGKTPSACAVVIVFYCCMKNNINVSKKQIIENNSISNVTLNKIYNTLVENEHLFC